MRIVFGILFVSLFVISCGNDQNTIPDDAVADNTVDNVQTDETNDLEVSDSDLVIEGPDDIGAMVNVPAGEFMMGCNDAVDSDCDSDENPYHAVTLGAYKIGKYEVTVGEYQKCVTDGACNNDNINELHYIGNAQELQCNLGADGKEKHPMQCVTWYGAKAYCEWKGKRLPTEAEWEKAARGTDGQKYPWGNEPTVSCDYAVVSDDNVGGDGCGNNGTMPVGSKESGKSPYGAYDMAGNVYEWASDWYGADYYSSSPTNDPAGPDTGDLRVLRGASWGEVSSVTRFRTSSRFWHSPSYTFHSGNYGGRTYGFRCVE